MNPKSFTRKKKNRGVARAVARGGDGSTTVMSKNKLNFIEPGFIESNIIQKTNDLKDKANSAVNSAVNSVANVIPTLDLNAAQMKIENDAKLAAAKLKGELNKQARFAAAKLKKETADEIKEDEIKEDEIKVVKDEIKEDEIKEDEIKEDENKVVKDENKVVKDENKVETAEETEAREAEEAAAAAREAEKAALIEALKIEIEEIEKELETLQPAMAKINEKSIQIELRNKNKENKDNLTIEELEPKELETFKNYVAIYKKLIEKNDELYKAENSSTEEWSLTSVILAPVKKFLGNLLGNINKMGAKATMASVTGMTSFVVACYKEIQPKLIEFAKLKGETELALKQATQMPDIAAVANTDANTDATVAKAVGGGRARNSNLKEIQRGGAAAAKRVENSIKQFLGSSITSSHILNMIKRKTKVKRNRESKGTRQSRRRAKSQ